MLHNTATLYVDKDGEFIAKGLGELKAWMTREGLTIKDITKIPIGVNRWKQVFVSGGDWEPCTQNVVEIHW